eukprot:758078-Hanusia_phi.AAC.2
MSQRGCFGRFDAQTVALGLQGMFVQFHLISLTSSCSEQPPFEILDYNVIVWDEGPSQYGNFGQARATVILGRRTRAC